MIDTHCHIHDKSVYDFAFSRQQGSKKTIERSDLTPEKMVENAVSNDVTQMICIGTTHADSQDARELALKFPGTVFWSYGIHPDEWEKERGEFVADKESGLVAIGEVGLDYKDGESTREQQIRLLEEMLQLAIDNDLPCIFHVRDAFSDFFPIIDNFPKIRGVVHSFSDSPENLVKSLEHNFYVGVNGLATFSELPTPPLENLLLETDAPFLTPIPFRGKINEPRHVKDVANWLSFKLGVSVEEIDDKTTRNAKRLFGIGNPVLLPSRST